VKYFLHDSNSFNDEKITRLFIEFGYEGLGLFYTILERLALQEKPVLTSVLKHQLKVGKKLNKCWDFMESIELISSNNGETFNKQLLSFSEKYQIKKEKNAKRISQWRKNQEDSENVTCNESVRNTLKVKESKGKERKDIVSVINNNTHPALIGFRNNIFKEAKEQGITNNVAEKFYEYWTAIDDHTKDFLWQTIKPFGIKNRLKNWNAIEEKNKSNQTYDTENFEL
jgi:hypothetical protein